MRKFLVCLVTVLILSVFGVHSAQAKMKEYSFVNYSGRTIESLYIVVSGYNKWGRSVLGNKTLANGDSHTIRYSDTIRYFDIKVVWTDGSTAAWQRYDYMSAKEITLFRNGHAHFLRKN